MKLGGFCGREAGEGLGNTCDKTKKRKKYAKL